MESFVFRTESSFREQVVYEGLKWGDMLLRWMSGGISPQSVVAQRRAIMDFLVEEKIHAGIDQVVEIGSGFSDRGLRMSEKFSHVVYADSDLASVVEQRVQRNMDFEAPASHKLLVVNALLSEGSSSLREGLTPFISPHRPVLFVMEGLANFLEGSDLRRLWQNIHQCLSEGAGGAFLSDYLLLESAQSNSSVSNFTKMWNQVFNHRIHFQLPSADELRQTLLNVGFDSVATYSPKEFYNLLSIPQFKSGDLLTIVDASQ